MLASFTSAIHFNNFLLPVSLHFFTQRLLCAFSSVSGLFDLFSTRLLVVAPASIKAASNIESILSYMTHDVQCHDLTHGCNTKTNQCNLRTSKW